MIDNQRAIVRSTSEWIGGSKQQGQLIEHNGATGVCPFLAKPKPNGVASRLIELRVVWGPTHNNWIAIQEFLPVSPAN